MERSLTLAGRKFKPEELSALVLRQKQLTMALSMSSPPRRLSPAMAVISMMFSKHSTIGAAGSATSSWWAAPPS